MARPAEFDRTRALDQAMSVFWCQGYEATSVDDLTKAMGIRPGSLYNTFKDKHSLFLETLSRYSSTVGSALFTLLQVENPSRAEIVGFFNALIEDTLDDPQRRGCFMLNAGLELASSDPTVVQMAAAAAQAGESHFRRALEGAQANGEIGQQHDLNALAAFLFSTAQGIRATAKIRPDRALLEQIAGVALSALN